MPWIQFWPSGIPWIPAGLIFAAVTFSLKKGYRPWKNETEKEKNILKGFAPTVRVRLSLLMW
jgi:hypothetical protein